jgi:hypothetical protein
MRRIFVMDNTVMARKFLPLAIAIIGATIWLSSSASEAQSCTTVDSPGSVYCPRKESEPTQPGADTQTGGYWEKRWGAITLDAAAKAFGTADGYASKGSANKAAITDCKKWGGTKCKVSISYHNQCGVLVSGEKYSLTARGPTVEVALNIALEQCIKQDPTCKLYHAGCSYAQRVR